ncbi:hypothetical protein MTR67_035749 [Solanum verrucosum]|uniref:Uncharacterized protein n=1 Tax=Solanum verrucosum TaxID=315347 RepID=A0AAF0ZML2_SOLVR|nr:hypothetical protein MTR67_035749 [Solanum verrucosum]
MFRVVCQPWTINFGACSCKDLAMDVVHALVECPSDMDGPEPRPRAFAELKALRMFFKTSNTLVLFAALVIMQVYCKEEQGFQTAVGREGHGVVDLSIATK